MRTISPERMHQTRALLVISAMAWLLGSCTPGAEQTSVNTTTTSGTSLTHIVTGTTSTTQSDTPILLGPTTESAEVAGIYQALFAPPFTVTIPDGWRGEALADGYVYFEWTGAGFDSSSPPKVAIQRFDFMVDPEDRDGGSVFPDDLESFISTHPALEAIASNDVSIAGESVSAIDALIVTTNSDTDPPRLEFGFTPEFFLVSYGDQSDVRFLVLDAEDPQVVVTIEVACCDRLDEFMPIADELLSSLKFESLVSASAAGPVTNDAWVELLPLGEEPAFWPGTIAASNFGLVVLGLGDPFGAEEGPLALFSTDGNEWEAIEHPPSLFGVSSATTGDVLVAVGDSNGGSSIWATTDGRNWEPVTDPNLDSYLLDKVAAGPNGFVGVGGRFLPEGDVLIGQGEVWSVRSLDGFDWELGEMLTEPEWAFELIDVASLGNGWVAVGNHIDPTVAGDVWHSTNGVEWTRLDVPDDLFLGAQFHAVASGPLGVVVVGERYQTAQVWVSSAGGQWQRVKGHSIVGYISDVVATANGFLAIGGDEEGAWFWESTDGMSWHKTWESSTPGVAPIAAAAGSGIAAVIGMGEEGQTVIWVRDAR